MHPSKQAISKKQVKEMVNINKNKQKVDLTKEFEQFKHRIQQFQNKNEQIISRIRDAYTIKKKAITNNQHYPQPQQMNQAYFQRYNDGQSVASSCDYSKNVVFQGNMMRFPKGIDQMQYAPTVNANEYNEIRNQRQKPPRKMQYQPSEQHLYRNISKISNTNQLQGYQLDSQYRYQNNYDDHIRQVNIANKLRTEGDDYIISNTLDNKSVGRYANQDDNLGVIEEKYRQVLDKNQELLRNLQEKEQELLKVKNFQNRFKNYANNLKSIVENGIEAYNEEIVSDRFIDLEKYVKKCQNRLKNISIKLKDTLQQRRSRRIIHRSRARRNSNSRAKQKDQSSMSEQADSTPRVSRTNSQAKLKNKSENPSKNKQFQQIALDYENMIKAKVTEIQLLEKQLADETRSKKSIASDLIKSKALLQQKQRELQDSKITPRNSREDHKENRQLNDLKEKLRRYEDDLKMAQVKEKQQNDIITKLQKSKKTIVQEYTDNLNKNKMLKNKTVHELQIKLKDLESSYQKQMNQIRQKTTEADKKIMEKQCEIVITLNKLKKVENQCLIKEEKLKQLQSILLKENDNGDLLDKSMSMDNSVLSHTEIRHLHENVRRLDEEIEEKNTLIYDLQKQKYNYNQIKKQLQIQIANLQKTNQTLQSKLQQIKRQTQSNRGQTLKQLSRQLQQKNEQIQQYQTQKELLIEEKDQLIIKNNELGDELKKLKQNNLTVNRQIIKINSQLNFSKNQYSNLQMRFNRAKEEIQALKQKSTQLDQQSKEKQAKLLSQNSQLKQQIQNLKNTILEIHTIGNKGEKEQQNLLNSLHVSQISFNYNHSKPHNEEQIALLRQKLREVQMALQIKESMEEQIQNQYRLNLEKIRAENSQRSQQNQKIRQQLQNNRKQLQKIKSSQIQDESFQNYKINIYQQKIIQMQEQYNALKQSEERLNEMLHEIVETVRSRDEQKQKLIRQLQQKDKVIEQYRELLQMKQNKLQGHSRTLRSDILRDSLRISADHSEDFIDTIELSYLSNISEVFKRDDILHEKIKKGKTTRQEHIRLFAKTSAYIKSLKNIIETKDKRIKVLEKQVTSMKNHEHHSWSDRSHSEKRYYTEEVNDDIAECDQFKDYQSVQLDTRKPKHNELIKQLQHEKNLAIEQNKILSKQIETFQDELTRAEEQENSLIRIKDLYKDEIKKLIEKNQIHTKEFETEIGKLREKLEGSQSYHNIQAIKQLFFKIMGVVVFLEDPNNKNSKREEKRKELQQYVKVMCSILHIDINLRDKLLFSLNK